jgi:hypothetical protein
MVRGLVRDVADAAAFVDRVEVESGERLLTRVELPFDAVQIDRAQHAERDERANDQ